MKRFSLIVVGLWLAMPQHSKVFADTTSSAIPTGADTTPSASLFEAMKPQVNTLMNANNFSNLMGSCMMQDLTGMMTSMAQGLAGAGGVATMNPAMFNPTAACPDIDDLPSSKEMSCGPNNDELVKKAMNQIFAAQASVMCKRTKIQMVQSQLQCLTQQAQSLSNQVGMLQSAFTQNMQRFQQQEQQIESVIKDREIQQKDVQGRLLGDKESGKPGLRDVKKDLEDLLNKRVAMPGPDGQGQDVDEITALDMQFKEIDSDKQALEETVDRRKMGLTMACFQTRTIPGARCKNNGPVVSAKDWVLCRYEQNFQLVEQDGKMVIQDDGGVKRADAAAARAELEALMGQIFGDTSANTKLGTNDPEEQKKMADDSSKLITVRSVDDIEKLYGEKLKRFNGKGLNIHDFVMNSFRNCYSSNAGAVEKERTQASSALYRMQKALEKKQTKAFNDTNELMHKYNDKYTEAMSSLTGQHMALNTSVCEGLAPAGRIGCLTDMRKNIQGVLLGSVPQSAINMMVKGANASSNISFQCMGINGCVTALENVSSNIEKEKVRLDGAKKAFVLASNQQVENFAKAVANQVKPQAMALMQRLKTLNTILANLGYHGIDLKNVEGTPLETDEAHGGLYKIPNSPMGVIASFMGDTPIPNISGDNFGSALSGLGEGNKKISKLSAKIEEASTLVGTFKEKCAKDWADKNKKKLASKLQSLSSSGCFHRTQFCTAANITALGQIQRSISDISFDSDGTSTDSDSLDLDPDEVLGSGIAECRYRRIAGDIDSCTRNVSKIENWLKDNEAKKGSEYYRRKEAEKKTLESRCAELQKDYAENDTFEEYSTVGETSSASCDGINVNAMKRMAKDSADPDTSSMPESSAGSADRDHRRRRR